jgi:hypothetical protein
VTKGEGISLKGVDPHRHAKLREVALERAARAEERETNKQGEDA